LVGSLFSYYCDRPIIVLTNAIQLVQGESNDTLSRLYARLPAGYIASLAGSAAGGFTLRGEVRGPFSAHGHTLPATSVFEAQATSDGLLAAALIPDPCYWSPRSPMQYHVSVSLCDARGGIIEECVQHTGLRMSGARRRSFFFSGERWVMRGVVADAAALAEFDDSEESRAALADELGTWREMRASLCIACDGGPLPGALLTAASEQGVVVLAIIRHSAPLETLRNLQRYSAVAFAAVSGASEVQVETLRHASPNIVIAQIVDSDSLENATPAPWAQALFLNAEPLEAAGQHAAAATLPVVAFRHCTAAADFAAARAQCDALQRDMARWSDCAGYVVHPQ